MSDCFIDYYRREGRQALQAVLFDVDGTLASGALPLPHAAELLNAMKADGFPYFLLTNDSCNSPQVKSARLRDIGIPVEADEIVSCAHTLRGVLQARGWSHRRFFVLGTLGTPSYADLAGMRWTDNFAELDDTDGIIIGEGEYEWKAPFEALFNHLLAHPEKPVIVPNPDSYWPLSGGHGELGVGAGALARFLFQLLGEKGVAVKPLYLGKPYPEIYRYTSGRIAEVVGGAVDMNRIGMIGDSLTSDICGGNRVGMCTILVLSGITGRGQLSGAVGETCPKMVFESL